MSDQVGFGAATSAAHVAATVNNRDAQQAPQGQQTADLARTEATPNWRDPAVVQGADESARQESRRSRDQNQQQSSQRQDTPADTLRAAEQARQQNKPAATSNKGPATVQDSLQRDAGERQKEVRRQEARDRVILTPTAAELIGTPDLKARFDMNTDGRVDQVELKHAIRARDDSNSYGGLAYHKRGTTEVDPTTGEVVIGKEASYPLPGEEQAEDGAADQEPAFPLPGEAGGEQEQGRFYDEVVSERQTYEELVAAGVIRDPAEQSQEEPLPAPPEAPLPNQEDGPSAYEELVESQQRETAPLVTDEPEPYLPGPTPEDGEGNDEEQTPPRSGGVSILA
ncbi:hypothetical protein [Roseospirillum parvum]|uniref:EF-hand domain-containing protein n=1 Tax=Roseospirillum parvum TaxID=83401 RepID=A0A1G7XTY8_9PROT|nr:hypothetical protein [Roseospirillum parvum]SDG87210.1 hypothetical protein SAMN05421742_10384 [Roseospirillum parvum]